MSNRSFRGIRLIQFSDFELDIRAAELRRGGVRIRLQEQPFRILTALLEKPGELVTRDEVRKRLWPNDTAVEVSHGINAAVQRLREALGESAENPRFIETLPRRGYRFVAPVQVTTGGRTEAAPQPETVSLEGNAVSHFRVKEKLGSGGMGVVYRAEDLILGRQVALKFLPRELVNDPGALGRFQREAQAASALNHPNICTIYGLEECDGQPVIVMELLEGETLEAILARGALPVEKAVSMAILIAAALDAAHRKGIVHRDLKPGNILVGAFGLKVLDFGLAKMDRPVVLTLEPAHATQKGSILGTLHYMSPEQAQGKDADASSDLFSFGVVLYEMLAGQRAFDGPNTARVMAAILTLDPKPLGRPIPPALELVLRRCLAKEPEERWQTARDLKAALEWMAGPQLPPPEAAPRPQVPFHLERPVLWGMACLCLLAALAFRYFSPKSGPARAATPPPASYVDNPLPITPKTAEAVPRILERSPPRLASTTTFQPGPVSRLSVSPDGSRIAFVESGHLYVLRLASGEKQVLGEAGGIPFWSPDGQAVAAASGNRLMRFDLNGSAPRQVCALNTNLAGAWGPDGTILIGLVYGGIYRVPATGGELEPVTTLDPSRNETRHLDPWFLPGGGQRFLYIRASTGAGRSKLYAGSLPGGEGKEIMPVESNVEFVADPRNSRRGYLLFTAGKILGAKTFDLNTLTAGPETEWLGDTVTSSGTLNAALSMADFSVGGNLLAFHTPNRNGGVTLVRNWTSRLRARPPQSGVTESVGQALSPANPLSNPIFVGQVANCR